MRTTSTNRHATAAANPQLFGWCTAAVPTKDATSAAAASTVPARVLPSIRRERAPGRPPRAQSVLVGNPPDLEAHGAPSLVRLGGSLESPSRGALLGT